MRLWLRCEQACPQVPRLFPEGQASAVRGRSAGGGGVGILENFAYILTKSTKASEDSVARLESSASPSSRSSPDEREIGETGRAHLDDVANGESLCADLAIKCATHSGSNVGRKNLGSSVPEADTYGISRFSQARFPAIPNPPMCRRVYDEVCLCEEG
jgi:hypothetical protein